VKQEFFRGTSDSIAPFVREMNMFFTRLNFSQELRVKGKISIPKFQI